MTVNKLKIKNKSLADARTLISHKFEIEKLKIETGQIPATVWNYSKLTEALRVLEVAHKIKNGFYWQKGFFVLPYYLGGNPKIITFPKLDYQKIPKFWRKVKYTSEELLAKKDPIIEEVVSLLSFNRSVDYRILEKSWQRVEKRFWLTIKDLLPSSLKGLKLLEIRPTSYGSVATDYTSWMKNGRDKKIVVYVRLDADVSHIAEAVLIYLLATLKNQFLWEEREAIIDFLLTQTPLAGLFPVYKTTLEHLRQKQQGKLAGESNDYLKALGLPLGEVFKLSDGQILAQNKPLQSLSPAEKEILSLLIERKARPVTFDEIAAVIWGEDFFDKFSPYAITKAMQRLRKKIEKAGVFPEIIQTIRSQGYLLEGFV